MSKPKIKLGLIINDLLVGGAQKMVLDIASYLDKNEFDITIYYLYDYEGVRPTLKEKCEGARIKCKSINARKGARGLFLASHILRKYIQKDKVDIVHAHLPDAVLVGGLATLLTNKRFVIHEHQTHQFHSWKIRIMYALLRLHTVLTICYAKRVERELFNKENFLLNAPTVLPVRSCTIPNGVDTRSIEMARHVVSRKEKRAEFNIPENAILVCSVARFVEWKGHRLLLEAFKSVAEQHGNAYLLILGDGDLYTELKQQVQVLKIEGQVRMPGTRSDTYEILAAADIFSLVFTYPQGMDAEAIGIAGMEAMAASLPIIIGRYGATEGIMEDGKEGIIIEPHKPQVLADSIHTLIERPELRSTMGMSGRERIRRKYSWEVVIKVYESVYSRLL